MRVSRHILRPKLQAQRAKGLIRTVSRHELVYAAITERLLGKPRALVLGRTSRARTLVGRALHALLTMRHTGLRACRASRAAAPAHPARARTGRDAAGARLLRREQIRYGVLSEERFHVLQCIKHVLTPLHCPEKTRRRALVGINKRPCILKECNLVAPNTSAGTQWALNLSHAISCRSASGPTLL